MTSKEGNYVGELLEGIDFSRARLRSPNFEGVRITDAWLRQADISGDITGLVVNGVEVAPLIEAELDRREPDRVLLRARDPRGLAEAWRRIEGRWTDTLGRADALDPSLLVVRVDYEWSLVETLRHLIMATDAWLFRMVRGESHPFHPWGLPPDPATPDEIEALGLDISAQPSYADVLAVRGLRMAAVSETIDALTTDDLGRMCTPPDTPGHPSSPHTVLKCLHVILDEEWMHGQYANRDLDVLERRGG